MVSCEARVYYIQNGVDIMKPSCAATSDGGCNCDYYVSLTTTHHGPLFRVQHRRDQLLRREGRAPVPTDYCANGSSLTLSGVKSADLFNRTSLKTLKLRPAQ